jgi:short-subunit dehydrogenase
LRVLISGASRGIGRALCEESLKRRWTVTAWVRDPADVPSGALSLIADVRDYPQVSQKLKGVALEVDLFIVNAGVSYSLNPKHADCAERALQIIEVNTAAAIYACYTIAHEWIRLGLKDRKIALVSSLAAGRGLPRSAVYGASKTALLSFAQGFEHDLRPHGISLSVIQPGFVETDMTEELPVKPFLMQASEAAIRILDGLKTEQFQVAFPMRTAWISSLKDLVPFFIFRRVVRFLNQRKVF